MVVCCCVFYFIYLFILVRSGLCAVCQLCLTAVSGLLLLWCTGSRHTGFSPWGLRALGGALWHVESSWVRDWAQGTRSGRWFLTAGPPGKSPTAVFILDFFFLQLLSLILGNLTLFIHSIFTCLLNPRIFLVSEMLTHSSVKNKFTTQVQYLCPGHFVFSLT